MKKIKDKLLNKELVIRIATTEDLISLSDLLRELFMIESDFTPNIRKQRQGLASLMNDQNATMLVAVIRNDIVGMCTLQPLISTAEGGTVGMVEDLIVGEKWRGQGVGGLLLDAIEKIAMEQNMSRLQLLTDKNNRQANEFYNKRDWSQTHMVVLRKKFD